MAVRFPLPQRCRGRALQRLLPMPNIRSKSPSRSVGPRLLVCALLLLLSSAAFADNVTLSSDVTTGVVVRASASSQTPSVGMLRPGEQALLVGSVPNWYRIQLSDGTLRFVAKRSQRVIHGLPKPSVEMELVQNDVLPGT
jgi:hypothetical protein